MTIGLATEAENLATKNTKITKGVRHSQQTFVFLVSFVALFFVLSVANAQPQETIAEIRVHGNHTTPDADVISLSGLATGASASEVILHDAEEKLKSTDRFDNVEVRRRFRSIDNPADILVIIVVDERAGVSTDDLTPGPLKRFGASSLWLPILTYADGYGLTYGAQVAFADVIGDRSRVSVPLTWGGERRAGVVVERLFDRGPVSALRVGGSVNRRVNPFYELADLRRDVRVETYRTIVPWLRVGGDVRVAHVEFGDAYVARHSAAGVYVSADTRIDPSFPRNAVQARVGWERMAFSNDGGDAGRVLTDARGYIGIGGSAVLALRGQLTRADAPLPAAEQSLLGGSDSLRGYRAGHRIGDSMAAVSAEVRLPFTSPLNISRFGVKGFIDAGTAWSSEERLSDQRFERGIGGGIFLGVAAFMLNLDLAWPEEGDPHVHFGMGVSF
jgi:outer membrane protein assembly factor BamA